MLIFVVRVPLAQCANPPGVGTHEPTRPATGVGIVLRKRGRRAAARWGRNVTIALCNLVTFVTHES